MWTTVSDSEFDHEREALAWLRQRLPLRAPYHVWSNVEFVASNGRLYEVDLLAVTVNGIHVVEVKSHPGLIEGDGGTWRWTHGKRFRQFDNPRILANRKAKILASMLGSTQAFRKHRRDLPFVEESVFLSDADVEVRLNRHGRHNIFGRDGTRDQPVPDGRVSIGGIVEHLTTLERREGERPRRRVQPAVAERVVKAMGQLGIRERTSRREVGDYRLGRLLDDVTAETSSAVAYQDFLATHRSIGRDRRLRVYPLELNASQAQREAAQRAARREYRLLEPLRHPGIVSPVDYTEHERGPVLFFDYEPAEVGLAEYLADPAAEKLPIAARLAMIREIAEAVAFAARHGVHHRALAPSAVLVTRPDELDGDQSDADNSELHPVVRVANWHAGARVGHDGSSSVVTGTVVSHLEALAADDTDLYRAPEFNQDGARPASLDVFSLGALALHILTGQPPASSARRLRSVLEKAGSLDPASVADGIDPTLAMVVTEATAADPANRLRSAEEFLEWLDTAEEEWRRERDDENTVPIDEARRGDVVYDARFVVRGRLGQGSTAFALLAEDTERANKLVVLKVANDPDHNGRLIDEAAALDGLNHSTIVSLEVEDWLEVDDRVVLVLRYAGPRREPVLAEDTPPRDRTLAARLAGDPIGVELAQRWGRDLLDAVRHLEQMGRAHRDIKPDNLGITTAGKDDELHLMLFDFSLSNASIEAIDAGTPGYIDPFLVKRGRWDPAADRYSAAVVLYELTTGRKPVYGDGSADPAMVENPQLTISPDLFDPAVADGLVGFFTRALAPATADRFDTADEMERAWHRAFTGADEPSTPSDHPDDDFVVPDGVGGSTGLAELPLSKRAVSALEKADLLTVEDLLAFPETQLHSLAGVGAKTRGEIREALAVLRTRFPPAVAPDPAPAGQPPTTDGDGDGTTTADDQADTGAGPESEVPSSGLAALAASCVPSATRKGQESSIELARIYAGFQATDSWASQAELAAAIEVTPARVSQLVGAHRKRWAKQPAITDLRHRLRDELVRLQVASVDQLATRLVAASTDPADSVDSEAAWAAARGLVRIATLTEESLAEPGWILRRRGGAALLAVQGQGEGPGGGAGDGAVSAQGLADYAVALAAEAGQLVAEEGIVSRGRLVEALVEVPTPPGVGSLPPAHLAELAADLCDDASVNARLELYPPGLAPMEALRASRRSLQAPDRPLSERQVGDKVRARFPDAAALPGRPELDELLTEAGTDLVWVDHDDPARVGYTSPRYEGALSTTATRSVSRTGTEVPRNQIPSDEWDSAAEFEARLAEARERGRSLVLLTRPANVEVAVGQLERLVHASVSIDDWLVDRLRAITADGKPSWETLTSADADGETGPAWGRLQAVVDRALAELTERLLATEGTVLLTDPGLLARYDRLAVVASWRDAIESRVHALQAVWLLVPAARDVDQPMVGGRAVPVTSRNQWAEIPSDWLRTGARVAGADL